MTLNNFDFCRFRMAVPTCYLAFLVAVLMYPFNFSTPFSTFDNTAREGPDGLDFGTSGMLRSVRPPVALYERLLNGLGLTVEVWLKTASVDQEGPARIVSYSLDPWRRNFTLGQERDAVNIRLRTAETDRNSANPDLEVSAVFLPGKLQYFVVTYDFKRQRVYVDGKQRAVREVPQGDFKDWDPNCFLVFGNEITGARAWRGTIAFTAIYDSPLTENTITARYQAGLPLRGTFEDHSPLLAFYFFSQPGSVEKQRSNSELRFPPLDLVKPSHIPGDSRPMFSFFRGADGKVRLVGQSPIWDVLLNVVLFVPFGVFLCASMNGHFRSRGLTVLAVVAVGIVVSACFEGLQVFLATRTSSIFDVTANAAGALCGTVGWYQFIRGSRDNESAAAMACRSRR